MQTETPEFQDFPKLYRLSRDMVVTEKLDGTNSQVCITESGDIFYGSRNKWITPQQDNYGFARWAEGHKEDLLKLGPGRHFGEWWGNGIQRKYGQKEKRLSLFNTVRWCLHNDEPRVISSQNAMEVKMQEKLPECVGLVPVLFRGEFNSSVIDMCLEDLRTGGSVAAPGFMDVEGIVVFHAPSNTAFKKTLGGDGHKGTK